MAQAAWRVREGFHVMLATPWRAVFSIPAEGDYDTQFVRTCLILVSVPILPSGPVTTAIALKRFEGPRS
jgi:hypothetical protein